MSCVLRNVFHQGKELVSRRRTRAMELAAMLLAGSLDFVLQRGIVSSNKKMEYGMPRGRGLLLSLLSSKYTSACSTAFSGTAME
jgi:hypothetical protein